MFAASKSGRSAGATDPYFPYVPLLLETTSTNGQQNNTFLDSGTANGGVGFTITRNGTPTQGSVTPYWPNGYWSNYFNGSSYLTTAATADFDLTTGNWTIQGWYYPTSYSASNNVIAYIGSATGNKIVLATIGTAGNLYYLLNGSVTISSATAAPLNAWSFFALVKSGATTTLYLNGVSLGTTASVPTTSNKSLSLGSDAGASIYQGYISNFRILKGTASSTVPTSPLTPETDTKLLICQSNRFVDTNTQVAAKTITTVGTPTVQAFQPFSPVASYTPAAYGGSGYFNNASADYLSTSSATAFQFGTGTFTIEGWFYFPTVPTNSGFWQVAASNFPATAGLALSYATGAFQVGYGASSQVTGIASGTIKAGAWVHIALVRNSSNNLTLYVDGVGYTAVASDTTNYTTTTNFVIAGYYSNGYQMIGYISNFRVVKGTAVYTGAFTPPTLAPLTTAGSTSAASYSSTTNVNTSFASSATSLLLNFTNAGIYDAAVQNNALTVGDAQVSTTITAKWPPTSMKFDGTGDWLTAVDGPQLNIGTGDFTIECWVNRTATASGAGNGDTIISKGTNNIILSINVNTSKFEFAQYGVAVLLTSTTVISNGTWYYVAITRSGTLLRMFINGAQEASTTNSANFTSTTSMFIGADANNTNQRLNGYIQDLRITKGVARTITASPTAAFPTR